MKLLRNGVLVAEGKARGEPGGDVILFRVKRWHVTSADVKGWAAGPLTAQTRWSIEDGANTRTLEQTKPTRWGVGVDDGLRTLDIHCVDANDDEVDLDVR